jgi:hypothetical protein
VCNLEWSSKKVENTEPTAKDEFLDKLPDGAIKIDGFRKANFNDYFYDHEHKRVIQISSGVTKNKIKVIRPSVSNGREVIVIKDIEDKRRTVDYGALIQCYSNTVESQKD